jgi:hypothetical protein
MALAFLIPIHVTISQLAALLSQCAGLNYFCPCTAALIFAGLALKAIAPQSKHEVAVTATREPRHLDRRLYGMNSARKKLSSVPGSRLLPPHAIHVWDEFTPLPFQLIF